MVFHAFVETVDMPCCVMSVEKTPAGTCGEIRIITGGIDRETFERKVQRLRSDVRKNAGVSFAIGACWSDGTMDFKTAFRYSDERMYADKKMYYDQNPKKTEVLRPPFFVSVLFRRAAATSLAGLWPGRESW